MHVLINGEGNIDNSFITGESSQQFLKIREIKFSLAENKWTYFRIRSNKTVNQSYTTLEQRSLPKRRTWVRHFGK